MGGRKTMKTAIFVWVSLGMLIVANCSAQTAVPVAETRYERKLITLQNVYAPNVASEITKAFNDGNGPTITVVADSARNALLVSAPSKTMSEVEGVVAQIDIPTPVVSVDVWFVDLRPDSAKPADAANANKVELLPSGPRKIVMEKLAQLEKEGRAEVVNHFKITTLDNQLAFAQQGERKPKITATNNTKSGRVSTAAYENMGTNIRVQPRVSAGNQIVMSVDAEKTLGGPESKGVVIAQPEQGPEVRATSSIALLGQTTVSIRSGDIVSVTGLVTSKDEGAGSYQVLVSAEVMPESPKGN
jgi:type II secretory pathway component GspD/PulD (secretin)